MTINEFWARMDAWREAAAGDTDMFCEAGQAELATLPKAEMNDFRGIMGAYMHHINECVWLDMACKVINGYVSDDSSLYFNLWVLAQGRQAVIGALADPDSLADLPEIPWENAEFEMLMTIGLDMEDFEDNAWGDADIDPDEADVEGFAYSGFIDEVGKEIKYKNDDRYGGFEEFDEAMAAIPEHCPRLIKRAMAEGFDWQNYI